MNAKLAPFKKGEHSSESASPINSVLTPLNKDLPFGTWGRGQRELLSWQTLGNIELKTLSRPISAHPNTGRDVIRQWFILDVWGDFQNDGHFLSDHTSNQAISGKPFDVWISGSLLVVLRNLSPWGQTAIKRTNGYIQNFEIKPSRWMYR